MKRGMLCPMKRGMLCPMKRGMLCPMKRGMLCAASRWDSSTTRIRWWRAFSVRSLTPFTSVPN